MGNGPDREYLGDGVEASFDGYMIALVADGTKTIYLEPSVYRALKRYAEDRCWPTLFIGDDD